MPDVPSGIAACGDWSNCVIVCPPRVAGGAAVPRFWNRMSALAAKLAAASASALNAKVRRRVFMWNPPLPRAAAGCNPKRIPGGKEVKAGAHLVVVGRTSRKGEPSAAGGMPGIRHPANDKAGLRRPCGLMRTAGTVRTRLVRAAGFPRPRACSRAGRGSGPSSGGSRSSAGYRCSPSRRRCGTTPASCRCSPRWRRW